MLMRPPVLTFLAATLLAACTASEGTKAAGPTGGTFIYAAPGDA